MKKWAVNFLRNKLGVGVYTPHLRKIALHINAICNASCPTCCISLNKEKGSGDAKYFSRELLERILRSPAVKGTKKNFNFLMTEPLLSPNIFELIKMVKDEGHLALVSTNGYLLQEKAKGLIDAGLDRIQVSIDGPPELHDSMRGIKGLFRAVIEGINLLNSLGKITIRVNCTVSNMNYKHLYELACILDKEVEIARLKYQFLNFVSRQMVEKQNKDYPLKQSIQSINEKIVFDTIDSRELSRQIMMLKSKKFKNIKEIRIIPNISSQKEIEEWFNENATPMRGNDKCSLPFIQVAIKPDGDVVWHMRCYDYIIGNVNKGDLRDIFYKGEKAAYFREVLKKNSFCMPACTRCCGITTHR